MKKAKQMISMLLVLMLSATAFVGCGGGGSSSAASTASSGGGQAASQAASSTGDSGAAASGERPTFNVATVRWTDTWPIDFLETGFMKEMEDMANVDIDWQVYYNSDWSEQKSLLLASGNLHDAFLGSISLNASDVSQNISYFVELTDLIEPNMPNLTAAFAAEPELKAIATDRDGKIYSLPKKLPLRPEVCGNVGFINQDWLDNLGLSVPTTYKELEDVLLKFASEDADGDGDATNEYGLTGSAGSYVLSNDLRNILSPFGTMVSRDNNYMGLNGDGNPVFMPIQDNYKEAVAWMRNLYENGAVDPEYFTQESSMATSKRQAEGGSKVGLLFGWTADAEAGINVEQFTLLEALEGPDGNRYVENAANFLDISDRELLITTKCADPAALLKWADAFYTDLGALQTFYGSVPEYVADNGDGTYSVLVPTDGSSLDTSAWSNSLRDFGPKYMTPSFYSNVKLPENQGDGVKLAQDAVNGKYVTDGKNTGFPQVKYTQEELERLATLGTDIYKYVEANYAKWVVEGGIDSEWDAYLTQLDNMGLQEMIGIQENAYKYYLEALA
ncbi:extracellular solute-binding protein [Ruminococcaceae bacterium OttesenSCG-928-L11]|nr:extracellular solute-binding protein [Ruminococcaceae bacterium OttesenSCG-928-L11]